MKRVLSWPRWSHWTWCFAVLMAGGIYASYRRAVHGLGPATHLSDVFPWGIGIGLNVLCGIALAVGGFTVAATVNVLKLDNFKPVVRACLLTGFLGYMVAVLGLVSDLGRRYRAGLLMTWNPRSILTGVIWVLVVYGVVLLIEFAPELFKHFGRGEPPDRVRALGTPALLFAVVLSTFQQSSLADLLQLAPGRVSPLWSTPQLGLFFFVSAVCGALAVVIFASWHVKTAFAKGLSSNVVAGMGKALAALLFLYLGLRVADFAHRGIPLLVWKNDPENLLLGLEIGLMFVPMWLLISERNRASPRTIYLCAVMVLAGLITNRLNTCITSVEVATGSRYVPTWNEFTIAYSVVALGVALFALTAKRLAVFSES